MINITSLIDVLFLLLIFLVVSTTFADRAGLRLKLPEMASSELAEFQGLTLVMGTDGQTILEGKPINDNEIGPSIFRLLRDESHEPVLILKADEGVRYGRVMAAIDAARMNGINQVTAVSRPKEESGALSAQPGQVP